MTGLLLQGQPVLATGLLLRRLTVLPGPLWRRLPAPRRRRGPGLLARRHLRLAVLGASRRLRRLRGLLPLRWSVLRSGWSVRRLSGMRVLLSAWRLLSGLSVLLSGLAGLCVLLSGLVLGWSAAPRLGLGLW